MNARKLVFVSLLGAGLALGCDQKPEGGAATASSSAKPTVASASAPSASASTSAVASAAPSASVEPKKHHRPRFGMVGMYFRAASKLADLDETQKTKLAEIEKGFTGPMEPPAEAKAYHDELVAQVKAGKIDNAKLEPLKATAEKAMTAHRDKELDALNSLHALLKAPQRTALVAALKAKQGKHMGMMGKDHPGMMGKPKDKLAHMTKELGLDDAQAKKVEGILPKDDGKAHDPEAWKKKAEAVQAAFEKDGFDAKKQELFTGKGMHGPMHGGMDSAFLEKLLAILKPEQREKLAANMAAGPKHHKGLPSMPPPVGSMAAPNGSASGAASGAPSNAPPAPPGGDDDGDDD